MNTKIKAIIWDLDGTLYSYSPNLLDVYRTAAAKTAIEMGVEVDFETAYALSVESFALYKNSFQIFVERYGFDVFEFDRNFLQNIPVEFIDINSEIVSEFSVSTITHAVLTHSSKEWAERVLSRLSIKQYFGNNIWGIEDVDFGHKDKSANPFQKVLSQLDLMPEECLVVEDTAKNLVYPKKIGMKTVLISDKDEVNQNYIDEKFDSAAYFLKSLNEGLVFQE